MMKPIGLLMIEHRLIERMVDPIRKKVRLMNEAEAVDPLFVDTMVDFIRTCADRCHHGKEENILFRDLVAHRQMETVAGLSKDAKYLCRICGRAATDADNLCEPVDIG